MKNAIIFFISIIVLTSCSSEIDLDKKDKTELGLEQLPNDLKKIYSTTFQKANDTTTYNIFSLDKNYELTHYWTGMHKQLLTKGFNHHFVINGKEFKLGTNKGDPFILQNKKLYNTTELNLTEYNFEKAKYMEIDLTEYLTE